MKYDYYKHIDTEAYPSNDVEYAPEYTPRETPKAAGKRQLSAFGLGVIQLSILLFISLAFIAIQLWSDVEVGKLTDIVREVFTEGVGTSV